MRNLVFLALLMLVRAPCDAAERHADRERVLFVGNSLIYVGNTPAVYSALSTANGHPSSSDMIVRGGATLAQRVADGSVARALATGSYTALVVQERGGDLLCSYGSESCIESEAAIRALAGLARQRGMPIVMLGTYQQRSASASQSLVGAEEAVAREAGILYAEVSEKLRRLQDQEPGFVWFAPDGGHPGKDLALLNAMLVYQALNGALPEARDMTVAAPIYGATSGLDEELRGATDPPPLPDITPDKVHYASGTMGTLVRFLGRAGGG
jgi:hypothetical protein